jgi:uncharacterized glyoxalase superfamily protein PhnB
VRRSGPAGSYLYKTAATPSLYGLVMTLDPNLPSVYPILGYEDAPASIRFLTEAFGLTEHVVHQAADGKITHAELAWGNGLVMISSASPGSVFDLRPCCLYLAVADPDAHHKRAVAAGAEIVMALTDQDYGSREYASRDPEGNVWCFGTFQPGPSNTDREANGRHSLASATSPGPVHSAPPS